MEDYRLPKDKGERETLSTTIGEDGLFLLACIQQANDMEWLQLLPAIQTLSAVWEQQYRSERGQVSRLAPKEMPPVGEWIRSPYDPEVRYGKKRSFEWMGYKVHLSECCDDDLPHLITQVETVPAIEQDHHALVSHPGGFSSQRASSQTTARRCGLYQRQADLAQPRNPRDRSDGASPYRSQLASSHSWSIGC